MDTLAQRVFDTAHNTRLNKAGAQLKRATNHAFRAVAKRANDPRQALQAAALIEPMTKDLPLVADSLAGAMKFSIDQNVADALQKMDQTPDETLLKAFKFAKPPFPKTWIEFCLPEGDLNLGWMIEEENDGLSVKQVMSTSTMNHLPMYYEGASHYFVNSDGFGLHPDSQAHSLMQQDAKSGEIRYKDAMESPAVSGCRQALILLLLLNSRSKILEVKPHGRDDEARVNNKRAKNGKSEVAFMNKIRFDVARILGKDAATRGDAAQVMAAQLVRGHFKLRKTGVFFWSPHVRGARDEEHKAEVMQSGLDVDRDVTSSGESALPGFQGSEPG